MDVVQEGFFVFFRRNCLGNLMGVRVAIEVVVGVVMLVWWKWSMVLELVLELAVQAIEERMW